MGEDERDVYKVEIGFTFYLKADSQDHAEELAETLSEACLRLGNINPSESSTAVELHTPGGY